MADEDASLQASITVADHSKRLVKMEATIVRLEATGMFIATYYTSTMYMWLCILHCIILYIIQISTG